MRILTVVGARPQFIKAAPLSHALRLRHEEILIHTGQHYDPEMSDIFFEELAIPRPDRNLGIGALSNLEQVSQMMLGLRGCVEEYKPNWILVYGDTNSTLAGALTGRLLNISVAHIEAGLRSYNRAMPEETNRVLTDHISSALFCPTAAAVANLAREGITDNVYMVGDVMIDALLENKQRIRSGVVEFYGLIPNGYYLATLHRASNTDDPAILAGIMAAFTALTTKTSLPLVAPAHPRLTKALERYQITPGSQVRLIPPVGYLDMLGLSASARLILTDSGGLQKEAYALSIPCVTLRNETEWVETVDSGWNRVAGSNPEQIIAAAERALATPPTTHPDFYGDGQTSTRIADLLTSISGNV